MSQTWTVGLKVAAAAAVVVVVVAAVAAVAAAVVVVVAAVVAVVTKTSKRNSVQTRYRSQLLKREKHWIVAWARPSKIG